jgi:predicted nucleic acid-binding Zn ribbon protein
MNTRPCPVCQTSILGRADKKYCSDQCRALANNGKKLKAQQILVTTNQRLRKNRTILKTLCPYGKATVRKEVLMAMGFELDFFTSIFITNTKQVYYLCYDFAYTPIREHEIEKALIVSRQEYMKNWDPWKFLNRK